MPENGVTQNSSKWHAWFAEKSLKKNPCNPPEHLSSKGITDLLLLNLVRLNAASSSKKFNPPTAQGSRNYLAGQSLVRYRN